MTEETTTPIRHLGRKPAKSTRKALMFSDFFKYLDIPKSTPPRSPIPLRSYGNLQFNNCTRAKQVVAAVRMERLEQHRTINVLDTEAIRVYQEMCARLYNGQDDGAYEDDALNEWRHPDTTFRDWNGRPYTIDAYLRINAFNHDELKAALAYSAAKGIAVCFNLPLAWNDVTGLWDVPDGQPLVGKWQPGSLGGHSSWATGYNEIGPYGDHTWEIPPWHMTWKAAAIYLDEAHVVIDSMNAWMREPKSGVGAMALTKVIEAVNDVSSFKIRVTKPGETDVYGR